MDKEVIMEFKSMDEKIMNLQKQMNDFAEMLSNKSLDKISIIASSVDDKTALRGIELYPEWSELPEGTELAEGKRIRHNDVLWKVSEGKGHNKQTSWEPGVAYDIFTAVNSGASGAIDDPILAVKGMEYIKGRYYLEDGKIYLMNRTGMNDGETIVLSFLPSGLIGIYFELVK